MITNSTFSIAVFPGDGIGEEIMSACLNVLENLERTVGGYSLKYEILPAQAALISKLPRNMRSINTETLVANPLPSY